MTVIEHKDRPLPEREADLLYRLSGWVELHARELPEESELRGELMASSSDLLAKARSRAILKRRESEIREHIGTSLRFGEFECSDQVCWILWGHDIVTVEDLVAHTRAELLALHRLGPRRVGEIEMALAFEGLALAEGRS